MPNVNKCSRLILPNEGLTGTFPSDVVTGWSQSLVALNVVDTMITGTMPPSFCSLPDFSEFDCLSANVTVFV